MPSAYPLLLDVSNRLIVIIGGGGVAARKAKGLIEAGAARVRVVSPAFCDAMPPGVDRIKEKYRPEHLEEAGLVFAATDDPFVNTEVVLEAHRLGLLVNRADMDEEEPGDFITPALLREGDITLSVSAGGSPTLAALVRDRLGEHLQSKWVSMAAVLNEYRRDLIKRGTSVELRRNVFRDLATDEAMDILDKKGAEGLSQWLKLRHPGL